jgi:hypothetical protein
MEAAKGNRYRQWDTTMILVAYRHDPVGKREGRLEPIQQICARRHIPEVYCGLRRLRFLETQ